MKKILNVCLFVFIISMQMYAQNYNSSYTGSEIDSVINFFIGDTRIRYFGLNNAYVGEEYSTYETTRAKGIFINSTSVAGGNEISLWALSKYSGTTGSRWLFGGATTATLQSTSGTITDCRLYGLESIAENKISGTTTWDNANNYLVGVSGVAVSNTTKNMTTNPVIGVQGHIKLSSSGGITNGYSFYASNYDYGSGAITNWYGFYSKAHIGTAATNTWHFYGLGNYPSWFGGNCNALGYNYFTDAQASDAYIITLAGAHTLVTGLEITFKANTANTTDATVNVNGLGVKALTKCSGGSVATALATGDIIAGQIVKAVYDGTQFQVISRLAQ